MNPSKPQSNCRLNCYPFTEMDLSCLLWSRDHHQAAHDAIIQAENRATDDPSRRPRADAYIRDCLDAIRRRMAQVEEAETIAFGFELQDRLVALYGPGVLDPPMIHPEPDNVPARPVKRKRGIVAAGAGGGLWG